MSAAAAAAIWIERAGGFTRRVHGRRSRQSGLRLRVIGVGLLVMMLCCALVWVRLQVVRTGYDLSTARDVEQQLGHEGRELALELTTLTSPRRLERLARTRLGMQLPEPGQIVNVR